MCTLISEKPCIKIYSHRDTRPIYFAPRLSISVPRRSRINLKPNYWHTYIQRDLYERERVTARWKSLSRARLEGLCSHEGKLPCTISARRGEKLWLIAGGRRTTLSLRLATKSVRCAHYTERTPLKSPGANPRWKIFPRSPREPRGIRSGPLRSMIIGISHCSQIADWKTNRCRVRNRNRGTFCDTLTFRLQIRSQSPNHGKLMVFAEIN